MPEILVRANGTSYVNGMSNSYDATYPDELEGVVSESEFTTIIGRVNDAIQEYWPCGLCFALGICCAPCAFLPYFPTQICMSKAEAAGREKLRQISLKSEFYDKKITFSLKKACCKSYIVVSFPDNTRRSDLRINRHTDLHMDSLITNVETGLLRPYQKKSL
jgi:hypothetical protein